MNRFSKGKEYIPSPNDRSRLPPCRYRHYRQHARWYVRVLMRTYLSINSPTFNHFSDSFRMFFSTFSNILGAVILIGIVLPWFLIAIAIISGAYIWAAIFYRASARELKVCIPPLPISRGIFKSHSAPFVPVSVLV